jgi:hypothetical protein
MIQSFVNCTSHVILLQWLNEGGSDGWGQVNADAQGTDVQILCSFEDHTITGMIILTASLDIGYPLLTVGKNCEGLHTFVNVKYIRHW